MLIPIVPSRPLVLRNAVSITQTADAPAITATQTLVQKFNSTAILATGPKIRLRVRPSSVANATISATYIGLSATSGNAWNFAATPTQIKWDNGQTSKILNANTEYESDLINFDIPSGAAISIAFNLASGSAVRLFSTTTTTDYIRYIKNSVSEAATILKGSTYTGTANRVDLITKLIVVS